jgi:Ni/Fe-hydrogenase subunit HybB-like protein
VTGFVFPNETVVEWDLLIVLYPYITGLVAGAFIVSSLYHVFGMKKLKPVARLSLISALAFLLVTPLPLVVHLGRPERALEMFLTPNLSSAMSGFGYIWFFYLVLVLMEIWLVFREDIVRYANASEGFKKTVYSVLALGVYDVSEASLAADHKLIKVLAAAGIPIAFLLHGYVGFIFGAVKANPWWSTPLMPIIFLMSATVSGMALLLMLYVLACKLRRTPVDYDCLRTLALWLGAFLSVNLVLEGLEVFSMLYEAEESWTVIRLLITQQIGVTYFGVQFVAGAVVPLLVLAGAEMSRVSESIKTGLRVFAGLCVVVGVFAMRWNVVIGGQLLSKSLRGFTSYTPPLLGLTGVVMAAALFALPFVILRVIIRWLPPWPPEVLPARRATIGMRTSQIYRSGR